MGDQKRYRLHQCGLTMVELLMALALVGVLIALVVPSMRQMVASQRVRGANSELMTDLQFARSEAVRMNRQVFVVFEQDASQSCYVVFVRDIRGAGGACSCLRGAGMACRGGPTEIKTTRLPRSSGVVLTAVNSINNADLTFDLRDGLPFNAPLTVDVVSDVQGQLRTTLSPMGRLAVCSPNASISGVPAC